MNFKESSLTPEFLQPFELQSIDLHFADFIEKEHGGPNLLLATLAAWVGRETRHGHVGLDLGNLPVDLQEFISYRQSFPDYDSWSELLRESRTVGKPGEFTPLVLDGSNRLYLWKFWNYEQTVITEIRRRIALPLQLPQSIERIRALLGRIFPEGPKTDPCNLDMQKAVVVAALSQFFTIVTGGPGTGKTFSACAILATLLENALGQNGDLRVFLTAPTGKAAEQLRHSLIKRKSELNCSDSLKSLIPVETMTLHRLLGATPGGTEFRYHEGRLLPADLLIIDEASMLDLPMMCGVIKALPPAARLILLGDHNQLGAVESGSVFADLVVSAPAEYCSEDFEKIYQDITDEAFQSSLPPSSTTDSDGGRVGNTDEQLSDRIILLKRNYRFQHTPELGAFIQQVRDNCIQDTVFGTENDSLVRLHSGFSSAFESWFFSRVLPHIRPLPLAEDPCEAFRILESFRILCALRQGPFGVESLNPRMEQRLKREGLIHPIGGWYHGRPVMVLRNDYDLRLFNGDIGIARKTENGDFEVLFRNSERDFNPLPVAVLPPVETVFAMTVHKAQGSEFQEILLLLPDKDFAILTRELVYTGITRAISKAQVCAEKTVFSNALNRTNIRSSGISEALRGGAS